MAGAEKLLGKGDMLFSPVGSTKPYRVQGPYISEKEIDKVIKFVKKEGGNPDYDEELKNAIENADKRSSKEPQDELTEDAIAFIFKSKQASVSMLQRRFRIGYNRAARIIDEIEEKGIIGPSDGSRPRQLLITEEEYYGGYDESSEPEPEPVPEPEPEPVYEPEPEPVYIPEAEAEPEYEMASEDDSTGRGSGLSNTRALDSFNSLPESVRRMIMDADSESDY
jgi:predicted transcriptional regulator